MLVIGIMIAIGLLYFVTRNKKDDEPEIIEDSYSPVYDDEGLAYLKVFYKHNEIQKGEVITVYDNYACFQVEGYDLKNYRKVLYPGKMTWKCPCSVVHFESETGLENCINCNTKGDLKRNISVKYVGGVTFSFKLVFH